MSFQKDNIHAATRFYVYNVSVSNNSICSRDVRISTPTPIKACRTTFLSGCIILLDFIRKLILVQIIVTKPLNPLSIGRSVQYQKKLYPKLLTEIVSSSLKIGQYE